MVAHDCVLYTSHATSGKLVDYAALLSSRPWVKCTQGSKKWGSLVKRFWNRVTGLTVSSFKVRFGPWMVVFSSIRCSYSLEFEGIIPVPEAGIDFSLLYNLGTLHHARRNSHWGWFEPYTTLIIYGPSPPNASDPTPASFNRDVEKRHRVGARERVRSAAGD
ncbi:uncharacterized protein BCR38DRAFT_408153 [Pseudomassariella vexata]|uniref:Uncharacterized protein n=1 Tax=Pseudomassariella vexata TaxID=1141098 RepID=A0A1Y2E3U3_9PEZI|nr:uncharacterized protein BCR38DRAFT_408153 [Pseudomassariella vexata]ORY66189.1 hypothetical protein BCR38DRAFT_408153 [Pseudomassariella vexata]